MRLLQAEIHRAKMESDAYAHQLVGMVVAMTWWDVVIPARWRLVRQTALESWRWANEVRRLEGMQNPPR